MPTLAIVIVSWNVRDLLDRCITSLHASLAGAQISYTIVVADNASSDGTPQMLRERHPEVRLIETGGNLGFGGGNNLAMRVLLEGSEPPELLLILNPDTEAVGDAIPTLVAWMQAHGDVAVVGPLLRYPDGSAQPSRRRLPTPGVFFMESTPLEWRWPDNRWVRRYRMLDQPDTAVQDVDWLVGAALLVRRAAIAQAGLFDERLTLYSEELEWQRRLRQSGRIVFLPQAAITHHEGQSSAQVPTRRLVLFHTNRLRYIRMAHGAPLALLVRAFLLAAYGAELLVEGGKWLIGHRRELRAQRAGAYASLLRALVQEER
jgi:N-acetylglucosaminyl-diphospho-decaprenol L-rhamnosyltransferase